MVDLSTDLELPEGVKDDINVYMSCRNDRRINRD